MRDNIFITIIINISIMKQTGFIILRHVNSELTNKYWIHCYECIRKYYPENLILIIDDNSNYDFITDCQPLYKTTIINSEYPGRGELLPYYYFLHNKLFDTAVIIHDSVFINAHIDICTDTYKLLWGFDHWWDQIEDETKMINLFQDDELTLFHEKKHLWIGCFGCMSIINHDYLVFVNSKYNISKLLDYILTRFNRCSFERVIACLLQINDTDRIVADYSNTLLGNIHNYCRWKITFDEKDDCLHLPIIKIWTGR